MNTIMPWSELVGAIEPFYPKPERTGPRPVGIERMLQIYCLQHWFSFPDPVAEEALYDSRAMRQFAGIDLGNEPVPDETTICKFRHLMERHNLGATAANVHDPQILEICCTERNTGVGRFGVCGAEGCDCRTGAARQGLYAGEGITPRGIERK